MTKITTDSPYYKWASEIVECVKNNYSFTTMRLAEKLEDELPDFLDKVGWCNSCEEKNEDSDREPSESYLESRGYQ